MSRVIPPAMRRALEDGVSHFCRCWFIRRRDGETLGLTDYDRPLRFNHIDFIADAAISLSALDARLGLDASQPQAQGVLSSNALTEADLAAGLYDDAAFDLWLVDWQAPENRMLLMAGRFDKIALSEGRFSVSLAASAGNMNAPRGRLFQNACDAGLGDERCRADISAAPFALSVSALDVTAAYIDIAPLAHAAGWFTHGYLANAAGRRFVIRADKPETRFRRLHLWLDPSADIAIDETLDLVVGCDKQLETCQRKFNNAVNYQGFPSLSDDKLLIDVSGR